MAKKKLIVEEQAAATAINVYESLINNFYGRALEENYVSYL